MYRPRVIPCLLLDGHRLVKTRGFAKPIYLGDPVNVVRIFNDKEVDELALLDIGATRDGRGPNFELLAEITNECFMPLAYGGGVTTLEQMTRLFTIGIEKVVLNTAAVRNQRLVREASDQFGSSSVVVSIDVRRGFFGRSSVFARGGRENTKKDPVGFAREMQDSGAGELLLTSIDRDGTMEGYDVDLIQRVASAVEIPVIASGGAGSLDDLRAAVAHGASAVSAGSFFVFSGPHRAVLISFPKRADLDSLTSVHA